MADRWSRGVVAGSTSEILSVYIRSTADSTAVTGLDNTDVTAYYWLHNVGATVEISVIAGTWGTFTSGGFIEVDATNMPGFYQFCPPDLMWAVASSHQGVSLSIVSANTYGHSERFEIVSVGLDTIDTVVDAVLVDTGTTIPGLLGTPAADISADIAAVKVDTAAVLVDTADMQPKIGTPAADLAADVAAVKVDTAAVLVDTADMQPKLGTPAANVSADIAAVKADTAAVLVDTADMQPKLGAPAGASMSADIAAVKVDTAATLVDTGTTLPATLGSPAGADMSTDIAAIKTDTAATLVDTGTTLPATLGSPAADISADIAAVKVDTAATLVDTADMQPKLGAPAADLAADIAAVKVDTAATLVDTGTTIPALLPAALVGGRMDANVGAISASTTAADRLEDSAETIIFGTAAAGTLSTTQMTSDVGNADDSLNGRVIIFKEDTTTAALRGVATDVTDFANATGIFTFTAIPTAPVNGDTFVVV